MAGHVRFGATIGLWVCVTLGVVFMPLFAVEAYADACAEQQGIVGTWRSKDYDTKGGRTIRIKSLGGGNYVGHAVKTDGSTGSVFLRAKQAGQGKLVGKLSSDGANDRTWLIVNGNSMTTKYEYWRKEYGWRSVAYSEYRRYCPASTDGARIGVSRKPGFRAGSEPNRQWFVHCKSLNPASGCGCVNHATNSYDPVQQAPWIQFGPGTWQQCGRWMNAQGFAGWEGY